jgi:hypothetical protein
MTTPYQRGRDPQPISQGWEVTVAVLGGAALLLGLAALSGIGAASVFFGGGWVWPHGTDAIGAVLGGLFRGQPGQGFDAAQSRKVAGPAGVYTCVALNELTVIAVSIFGGVLIARYRRPGDTRRGMASRHDASQVLGRSRLHAARSIIRPDLYPTRRRGG